MPAFLQHTLHKSVPKHCISARVACADSRQWFSGSKAPALLFPHLHGKMVTGVPDNPNKVEKPRS